MLATNIRYAPKSLILDIFNAGSLGGSNDCLLLSNFKSLFPLLLILQLSVEPWVAAAAAALKAFGQDKGQIVHEAHSNFCSELFPVMVCKLFLQPSANQNDQWTQNAK